MSSSRRGSGPVGGSPRAGRGGISPTRAAQASNELRARHIRPSFIVEEANTREELEITSLENT